LQIRSVVANRACGAERLVGPARSAGTQLQIRSVVANRAFGAERLARRNAAQLLVLDALPGRADDHSVGAEEREGGLDADEAVRTGLAARALERAAVRERRALGVGGAGGGRRAIGVAGAGVRAD